MLLAYRCREAAVTAERSLHELLVTAQRFSSVIANLTAAALINQKTLKTIFICDLVQNKPLLLIGMTELVPTINSRCLLKWQLPAVYHSQDSFDSLEMCHIYKYVSLNSLNIYVPVFRLIVLEDESFYIFYMMFPLKHFKRKRKKSMFNKCISFNEFNKSW